MLENELYLSLFKNNPSIMMLIDPVTLDIADVNLAAVSYYGWNEKEFIKKKLTNISTLQREKILQETKHIVRGKKHNFFCCHSLANGSIRNVEISSSLITLKGNLFFLSVINDIAGLKRTEETINGFVTLKDFRKEKHLRAEAIRASHLAALGELAAGVAHEINNPVTGIISIAEILADKFYKLGGDRKIPERIISEGERIGKIVNNLLSFARKQGEEHNPEHVDEIFRLSLDLVKEQLFKDGIHLSVHIHPDIPKIKMNRQEIQQVVLNLLSNARYAVKQKLHEPHLKKAIEITSDIVDIKGIKFASFMFHDNGIGIPEKYLNKISNPFFSTKPQGEGTGLGLSISHGIIKKHGGYLRFDSREGEYTKVIMNLPVWDVVSSKECQ